MSPPKSSKRKGKKPKAKKPVVAGLYIVKTDTKTDDKKALEVCDFIMGGDSLRSACYKTGLEVTKFMRMTARSEDEGTALMKQYLRAREARADMRFEDIEKTIEDLQNKLIDPQSANVIINAKFRQMGKENSKRYGEKLEVEQSNKSEVTVTHRIINSKSDLADAVG